MKKKKKLYSGENTAIIVSSEDETERASRLSQERRTTIRCSLAAARLPAGRMHAFFFFTNEDRLDVGGPGGCPVRRGGSTPRTVGAHLGGRKNKQNSTAAETALRAESILNRLTAASNQSLDHNLPPAAARRCHAGSYFSAPAGRLRACCRRASD